MYWGQVCPMPRPNGPERHSFVSHEKNKASTHRGIFQAWKHWKLALCKLDLLTAHEFGFRHCQHCIPDSGRCGDAKPSWPHLYLSGQIHCETLTPCRDGTSPLRPSELVLQDQLLCWPRRRQAEMRRRKIASRNGTESNSSIQQT